MQTPLQIGVEANRTTHRRPTALSPSQIGVLVAIGIAFWFAAAMAVFYGSPFGIFGPTASLVTFIVTIPLCWVSVLLSKKIARLGAGQTLPGIAIGVIAATCSDAVALTWAREVYGSNPAVVVLGAAWILWGVGFFLLFAYLDDYRQLRKTR